MTFPQARTESREHEAQVILLVEDESLIAMAEKMVLERAGYTVITARTGEKAIEIIASGTTVELVLMDIDLGPGLSGTEVATRILAERELPVVFLSSHTEREVVEQTEGITSYGYIVKNSGETVLLASIKMAFRLHAANQTVRENEKLYRTLMENNRDGVKLIDREGKILNANQAACEMIGYTREELLSLSIPDIDPDYDRERFMRFWDDKGSRHSAYLRTTHRHKSGHIIPVEIHVIRFELDGAQLIFGISRDITEQTMAEEALRRSEEHFRNIVQDSAAAYFRIGRDGCFQDVNAAWLTLHGYDSSREVIGRHFSITQLPGDLEVAERVVRKIFRGETVTEGEFSRLTRDGTVGHHRFAAAPVYEAGKVVAVEGFLIDTTEYRRTASVYSLLFRHMPVGFALHEMIYDSAGIAVDYRFLEINPAFEKITGLTASDLVGQTVLTVLPRTEKYWIETYAAVAETGSPVTYRNRSQALDKEFDVRAFSPERGLFATVVSEVGMT